MKDLGEVITAMVTPFNDKLEVDYGKARELAVRLAEEGSDGLVVCGTTGESPTLTTEEKVKLFSSVREAVGDRASVIAGVGSYSTAETILLAKRAEETGVDGLLVVVPYYNKPPQEGLYYHFQLIAENTSLPIILYNIPGRTGVNMTPETVGRLAQVKNIVGIKEASGNLDQVSEILRLTWMYWSAEPKAVTDAVRKYYPDPSHESKRAPEGNMFEVWSGDDGLTLPMLAIGAKGVVSVASHLVGPWIKTMIRSFQMGEVDKARGIHLRVLPLLKALFMTTNPIPVKAAMRLTGFDVGKVRPPLVDLTPGEEEKLRKVLDGLATSIKMGKELALGKTR